MTMLIGKIDNIFSKILIFFIISILLFMPKSLAEKNEEIKEICREFTDKLLSINKL